MPGILVLTTVNSKSEAESLARMLVSKKLAACVNVSAPVISYYEWQGVIEEEQEYKLFIKSTGEKWPLLKRAIQENHTYEVAEISRIDFSGMNESYQKWLEDYLGG